MDINIAIGILTGSLGTILITKIFEYFSERRIFKRELKKHFFAKKLEAAEKAMKFYVSSNSYYGMLQSSFELFINDGDISYISRLANEASAKCKFLWDTIDEQICMKDLYFDHKPITWYPEDNVSKIANYFSELQKKNTETGDLSLNLMNAKINKQVELIKKNENHYAILKEDMKQIAKELIKCIDIEKRKNDFCAKVIRDELKKYDV